MQYLKMHKVGHSWMFTDTDKGLIDELLVDGADDLCDRICNNYHIDPVLGFTVGFSDTYESVKNDHLSVVQRFRLNFLNAYGDGFTYIDEDLNAVWLCENLVKYFISPPSSIFFHINEVDAIISANQLALERGLKLVYSNNIDIVYPSMVNEQFIDEFKFAKLYPSVDWINYHLVPY